ncbi:hypothetical protein SAMN04487773_3226 [Enterobacter sp. kpr-6]|uniref:hypothetical protein n=1 Tax=Enterobacter sp. kpr-6 TaxID=1761782 RepID=UPI0008E21A77|nr:hypothetical protein [Enterobacter sp. kpr-6]SFR13736.1 hypothetical protein SAMN04487773_3226 [Enterobacter sp. kpr-6]
MELLEASEKLERIEVLAKIVFVDEVNDREKMVALEWIGEIAHEMREIILQEMKNPHVGGLLYSGGGFQ